MDKLESSDMTAFSDLPPHLIFGKILFPCPTKVAVELSFLLSKKFWDQDVVSYAVPVLDFDEDDDFARHNLRDFDLPQHEKFCRFLEGYVEYYRKKGRRLLDKLRLKMRLNSSEDATILGQWLELAFERGVKELEISRPTRIRKAAKLAKHPLSWMTTFANAKSLTSLKLVGVRLTAFGNTEEFILLLPSLKTLSLQRLIFAENDDSLYKLLHTCPSIEYLSLNFICLDHSKLRGFRLPSLSLKSLEFIECNPTQQNEAYQAQVDILESFTWVVIVPVLYSWTMVLGMVGKSLTYLRLGVVKIDDFPSGTKQDNQPYFPSLKTISLEEVRGLDLLPVLSECPTLENLSLVKCRFKKSTCCVENSTLKSLEVKHCRLELLQVHKAKNLESFTFFSQPLPDRRKPMWSLLPIPDSDSDSDSDSNSKGAEVIFDNSFDLKIINICVTNLVRFSVNGGHPVSGGYENLMDFFHTIAPSAQIKID